MMIANFLNLFWQVNVYDKNLASKKKKKAKNSTWNDTRVWPIVRLDLKSTTSFLHYCMKTKSLKYPFLNSDCDLYYSWFTRLVLFKLIIIISIFNNFILKLYILYYVHWHNKLVLKPIKIFERVKDQKLI